MDDIKLIAGKLTGPVRDRQRRVELLNDLQQALAQGGPETVADLLAERCAALADEFASQVSELRKLI